MGVRTRALRLIRAILPGGAWSWARGARVCYAIWRYKSKRVRHRFGSEELTVEIRDPLAAGWYDRDWSELPELSQLKQHRLRPGAKVFDIGAHQCVVAMLLAKAVQPGGTVIAVEANPHNAESGRRNLVLNKIDNCIIVEAAAGRRSGRVIFSSGLNGKVDDGTGEWGRQEVEACSIDDLSLRYGCPDVLFVDVEGFECEVLAGGKGVLSRRPDCLIEVHARNGLEEFGGSVDSLLSFFPRECYYDLTIRLEDDAEFTRLGPNPPDTRFFLLAIGRPQ